MSRILKAKKYAIEAHKGQTYGEYPYQKHLNDVYLMLKSVGVSSEIPLAVSWLHDTIEDTVIRYEDVVEAFGIILAEKVYAVTDKRGKTRKERHKATYPSIATDPDATVVKWADRAANILMSQHSKQSQFFKYQKEHVYFKEVLSVEFDIPEIDEAVKKLSALIDALLEEGPYIGEA